MNLHVHAYQHFWSLARGDYGWRYHGWHGASSQWLARLSGDEHQ